jgi:hypothetical protein
MPATVTRAWVWQRRWTSFAGTVSPRRLRATRLRLGRSAADFVAARFETSWYRSGLDVAPAYSARRRSLRGGADLGE